MTTTNPNGIGAGIARAMTGSALEVRWLPHLVVSIDGAETTGVQAIEFWPAGAAGNTSTQHIVMSFQGSSTSPRSATVARNLSSLAISASGDGFTATMTAPS